MTKVECPDCKTFNRVPITASGMPRCAKCHTNLPWLADVRTAEFDRVISSSAMPILVDLWAPWCGPCQAVGPILEHIAHQRAGSLRVVKINVDHEPDVSASLGVQGIPTMVLFNRGVEVGRQVGAIPAHRIDAWIDASV